MALSFPHPFKRRPSTCSIDNGPACSKKPSIVDGVTLARILNGETKSPISKHDLLLWLRWTGGIVEGDGKAIIDFVVAFEDYKQRFSNLSTSDSSLSLPPFQVISNLSSSSLPPPRHIPHPDSPSSWYLKKSDNLTTPPPAAHRMMQQRGRPGGVGGGRRESGRSEVEGGSDDEEDRMGGAGSLGLSGQLSLSAASKRQNGPSPTRPKAHTPSPALPLPTYPTTPAPDPTPLQPLRASLQSLISRFLLPLSPRPLNHLLPSTAISQSLSESSLTTHPDVLAPLAGILTDHFEDLILPQFLLVSVQNLSKQTARGRLLVGVGITVVVVGMTVGLLLDPSPFRKGGPRVERAWRLLLVPVLIGGFGYALGSYGSLCFWLALFGITERKPYQEEHAPLTSGFEYLTKMPSQTISLQDLDKPKIKTNGSFFTLENQPGWIKSRYRQNKLRKKHVMHLDGGRSGGLLGGKNGRKKLFIAAWRLTGTAWGTKKVEDPSILKAQRRGVLKICLMLGLGLAVSAVVLYFLPYINIS